ncbi:MAG: dockerin type I domain-containing protein, partial [Candidatus Zixiibacteriota bacterium]
DFSENGYHEETFYARSIDGGVSWSDSLCISNLDNITSWGGDIAAVGSNVYVVWEDWSGLPTGGIYFRKSTDGGATWQSITPVALRGVDDYDYYRPTIAAKDSSVFVAFAKNVEQNSMFRFKKSLDYGETWLEEIAISERGVTGTFPKLVLNLVGLHVGYQSGFEIYYNRSADWGDTWDDDILISEEDGEPSQWASIGVDDKGGVYVSWFDYKYSPYAWTGDIFLRRSTDNGETWDSIISLTDNHLCLGSDVCADTFTVHVVWRDERHGSPNFEIYHRRSTNQGVSWLEENRLTDAPNQSVDPSIATSHPFLHLSWVDSRDGHGDAFYKKVYWWIPGDANADGQTNVSDIIFLINYLFVSGPSPEVFESADANGDGEIDGADIVYLINYLFIGGPSPVEC